MMIIERFEGDIAILENTDTNEKIEINRKNLPDGTKEGDVIENINGVYNIDKVRTIERREQMLKKLRQMGL